MAAKRISGSTINWSALAEKVPKHQKPQFLVFKAKCDQYLKRVGQYPEAPPKIDWAKYKKLVPIPGMVDEFEKQYNALQIPYPPNNLVSQLDALENEIKSDIQKFKADSDARIVEYKKQLAYLASLIPYDQMTMEDYKEAYPDDSVDPINKPSFWPHNPEEQLGYKSKEQPASSH